MLELYLALDTQWRVSIGMGGARVTGFDYAAVEATMRMRGVKAKDRPRLLAELRDMEHAAMAAINRASGG